MYKNETRKVVSKSQADGPQTIGTKGYDQLGHHQIQVEVSAQPSAGTLAVEYKTPGAAEFVAAAGSPIDLTALNKAAVFRLDYLFFDAIRFTPAGLDAGKTYSVIVTSNE